MKYVEVTFPDGRERLYRFGGQWSAEDFVEESPDTRRMMPVKDAVKKYRVYTRRRWVRDKDGHSWTVPK